MPSIVPSMEGKVVCQPLINHHIGGNVEFRPSYKSAAIESTVVALLVALAIALFFYFAAKPMWFSVPFALASGAMAFAFYFGRFMKKAPIVVRLSDNSLTIVYRSKEDSVSWADVRNAHHESDYGLQWRLVLQTRTIVVRDDGFSTTRWDALSKAMNEKLGSHGITVKTDGYTEAFVDDDDSR